MGSAHAFRDKLTMKQALAAAAVPIASFSSLNSPADVRRFAAEVGYPIVVKPREGADSQGIVILRDDAALVRFAAATPNLSGYLAERYVAHELLHCDGVLVGDRLEFAEVWSWSRTMLDVRSVSAPTTAVTLRLDDDRRPEVLELTRRALSALPSPPVTAFHIEFLSTDQGLLVNEAASRVGGGRIQPTLQRLDGVDIVELTARCQTDSRPELVRTHRTAASGGFLLAYDDGTVLGTAPARCPLPGISHYETCLPLASVGQVQVAAPELLLSGVATGPDPASVHTSLTDFHHWFLDSVIRADESRPTAPVRALPPHPTEERP